MLPPSLQKLIDGFKSLPGIGEKSAQRYAFFLLNKDKKYLDGLGNSILQVKDKIKECEICCNYSEDDLCEICKLQNRRGDIICVVENPFDVISIERPRVFKGMYHVLHGILSPIDGVGPNDLRIERLLKRIEAGNINEVIFAINPTLEGEATNTYLSQKIKEKVPKITMLARGISVGGDLEYTDDITLSRAIQGRINY